MTDTLGLGDELRRLGTQLQVSDTGYVTPADTSGNLAEIQIHFDYDQANQPIVRTTIELGTADRHRFPEYMATSQTLSIGILGLLERNNRAIERLVLVDSRFYSSMSFTAYHSVLRLMANDARQLIESNFNWKSRSKSYDKGENPTPSSFTFLDSAVAEVSFGFIFASRTCDTCTVT